VRELLTGRGARAEEIEAHNAQIDRVRKRLASVVRQTVQVEGVAA
jgi:hypothetical protein